MTISAVQASTAFQRLSSGTSASVTSAKSQDIEAFTKRLLAGGTAAPEHQVVNQLQKAQQSLMMGIRDDGVVRRLSPESALNAQARLASSAIGVDVVAKVTGSFSTAINKLVSMQ
ncbi:MAG: type III secretion system inner rod subunit SctI [Kluyvera sp.]|uniref:type III secretion system inner rod subunit SctI n=1 Tax=Kluyvera sp. TaxID=1538228 RepID=UPI003F341780